MNHAAFTFKKTAFCQFLTNKSAIFVSISLFVQAKYLTEESFSGDENISWRKKITVAICSTFLRNKVHVLILKSLLPNQRKNSA